MQSAALPSPLSSLSILLAEDNPINQDLFKQMLERLGHRVHAVGDGIAVLEALQQQTYDVVLLDLKMPRLDGLATAVRICQMSGPRPVLIALTANSHLEDQDRCLQAGMDDFLSKPLRMMDLSRMLDRYALRRADMAVSSGKEVPDSDRPIHPSVNSSDHPSPAPAVTSVSEPPSAHLPIDFQHLRQLKKELADDDSFFSEMLQSYWRTSATLIQQIQFAAQEDDPIALEFALHGLKSISASIGAYPLVQLAEQGEQHSQAGTIEPTTIDAVVQAHQAVCQALQQELTRLSLVHLDTRLK
ncbi:response regulator [Alkalinema pantanalense CENA528]|uniref:response regulator n=1 Tax=Alkalinema pantanalense TaxID=1620705 RepID=UPI003D6EEF54